jgi:hypothetical protein
MAGPARLINTCIALAVACALLLWAAPVQETFKTLSQALGGIAADPAAFRRAVRTPGAGLDVLPREIPDAVALLKSAGVRSYHLSPAAAANFWFSQQTEALAWPLRPTRDARDPTLFLGEKLPGPCSVLGKTGEVVLARCP